jgi:hypothetical protein
MAAEMAKALSARAFTTGRDVVFGAGQYAPETDAGKRLLAHELTHVVHQLGDKGDSSLGNHFDENFEQDSQGATPVAPHGKLITDRRFSQPSLIQMKNGSKSTSMTLFEWTITEDGRLYRNIRWGTPELSEAGYEILTYVKTEKGWEQKVPAMGTPVSQVRWLIKPPKGKGVWADARHIVPKLMRIVKKLRAAKPKEKIEKIEPVKFFSDPKFENIGSPGEWKLKANTKEGVKFYEDIFRGDTFAVEVPCFTREPGEMATYIRRETVTLKSGQRLGDLWVIGGLKGMVLVKHSFYGEPAIFEYWPDFFYKAVRDKADTSETLKKQLEEICTK